jgi:hypothetical protein
MRLAAAGAVYALASIALFGREVVRSPDATIVGDDGADKSLYLWSLEWWPWALRHRHNPLDVDVAWMPNGFDFGLGTAGGGLAVVAWPLTALAGPVPAYNVLILLAPALAATTAFLLAHHVTRAFLPSLVGGWVFGFSSYELGRILGHLPLAFVALLPLIPYLVLRRYAGDLSRRRFVVLLALVLAAQFFIVTQTFFTLAIVGACAAAAAAALLDAARVRTVALEGAAAFGLALCLVSPVIAYALVSDAATPARSPFAESADVLNYVVPTRRTWVEFPGSDDIAARFTGTGTEQGAYLGIPFLALAALAVMRRPLSRPRLFLGVLLVVLVILSLGTRPKIAGVVVGVGPWSAVAWAPAIESALPARLTVFVSLLAGLLVALALADGASRWRWLLAVAGIVVTLPNLGLAQWSSPVPRPTFFTTNRDERHLADGERALVLPYGPAGWSMLWQAEDRFRYHLVGGHFALRVTPSEEQWRDVYEGLPKGLLTAPRLQRFLRTHCVDVVVATPGTRAGTRRAVEEAMGPPAARSADAAVYRPAVRGGGC